MLERAIPNEPANNAPRADKDAYQKHVNDSVDVTCLMLLTMIPKLQKQFEEMEAFELMAHLKELIDMSHMIIHAAEIHIAQRKSPRNTLHSSKQIKTA